MPAAKKKTRQPADAVVSNVKRLRADVRALTRLVHHNQAVALRRVLDVERRVTRLTSYVLTLKGADAAV